MTVPEADSTPAEHTPAEQALVADTATKVAVADTRPWVKRHRRALVIGSRTALLMLFIAGLVILGLGLVAYVRNDEPQVDGWLRTIFGTVFAAVALGMAAVLGIPSAIGLWAMSGATKGEVEPALSPSVRHVLVAVAVATLVFSAAVILVTGSSFLILNLGLIGLIALSSLGLAGAVDFSPHRGRAVLSGVSVVLVSVGALWVLAKAFIGGPG
jgi:hypothetical protein